MSKDEMIASAFDRVFVSPNESDSNMEAANVVDGLFAIARAINRLSSTIETTFSSAKVGHALDGLASIKYGSIGHE